MASPSPAAGVSDDGGGSSGAAGGDVKVDLQDYLGGTVLDQAHAVFAQSMGPFVRECMNKKYPSPEFDAAAAQQQAAAAAAQQTAEQEARAEAIREKLLPEAIANLRAVNAAKTGNKKKDKAACKVRCHSLIECTLNEKK